MTSATPWTEACGNSSCPKRLTDSSSAWLICENPKLVDLDYTGADTWESAHLMPTTHVACVLPNQSTESRTGSCELTSFNSEDSPDPAVRKSCPHGLERCDFS